MPIKEKIYELKKGEKIPLMFDGCMKIMFGNNERLEPLTLLLSRILEIPYEDLEGRIEVVSSTLPKKQLEEKKTERDIVVRLSSTENQKIVIEVNIRPSNYSTIINRNLYYFSEVFTSGLKESETYNNIENTFLINLNTFYTDSIHKKLFDYYYIMNEEGYILTEKQKILNINIAKCYRLWYTKSEVKFKNAYEKDLFYLCAAMVTDKENEFKECLSKIDASRSIKEEMEEVSSNMSRKDELKLDYYNFMEDTKRINDGILEEVEERGRKEGIQEGIQRSQKEMIINMYNKNISIDTIAECSNLSVEKVKEIIDNQ